ncbi:TIGR02679 family protein [Paenibacillus sp. NPDC058174]|uniref:TIGR02679 family protein n=1 Tax=Paenibacillus sp. NPDC058174 TaxID=3346366 RepID=UPI0036D8A3F2
MNNAVDNAVAQLRNLRLLHLLDAAREHIEKRSNTRGSISIICDEAQKQELINLVGYRNVKYIKDGKLQISLEKLDEKLEESFLQVRLLHVIEAYSGPILMRKDKKLQEEEAWTKGLKRVLEMAPNDGRVQNWIEALNSDGLSGRRYRRAYNKDSEAAERAARMVVAAIKKLPLQKPELLALFAAHLTGNPHAFDTNQLAGRLLLAVIEEQFCKAPSDLSHAEIRIVLLGSVGLEVDGLSSTVLVAYLTGTKHPVLEVMASDDMGWPVPLHVIRTLSVPFQPQKRVFVLENPQAFEYLTHSLITIKREKRPVLLCTGGFLSASALILLDRLNDAGFSIYYGGDFDKNGLAIAQGLMARYKNIVLWRMSPSDYKLAYDPNIESVLSIDDKVWLNNVSNDLAETANEMIVFGKPAYQERLSELLLNDLLELNS